MLELDFLGFYAQNMIFCILDWWMLA